MKRPTPILIRIFLLLACFAAAVRAADTPRQVVAKAMVLEDSAEQVKLITSLAEAPAEEVTALFNQWKEGGVFLHKISDDKKVPVILEGEKDAEEKQIAKSFETGEVLKDENGAPLKLAAGDLDAAETDGATRSAMKGVTDLFQLSSPDWRQRVRSAEMLGMEQSQERIPALKARLEKETDSHVKRALREAIAINQLASEDEAVKIAACKELGELGSIPSQDILKQLVKDATENNKPALADAGSNALRAIASHITYVNTAGTLFRGLSLGSILLIAAIGLAITFGLMGVINMAHGEMIAIGAYTTYVVQCIFGSGLSLSVFNWINVNLPALNLQGWAYDSYFLIALPLSFLVAAVAGIILERTVIRFLYRRPLESLLATWGVSLVMQQLFRLTFGANNVQVSSPSWLSGNWTVNDILFGWNRVFVICFAIAIVIGLTLLLKKTPLGLLIRAVMQNRGMAACMGVRTERVNMLTFGLGSGLAGLAGAFLSQIGNVGPSLGQAYIVDSFMTVVVGGVGNLIGTVISALGIGMLDQSLQQILGNPVLGKILVLAGIILFLQWKPAGLFVTKSRSLEG